MEAWICKICGQPNKETDIFCIKCDGEYGLEDQPYDLQFDDIDAWE